MTSIKEARKAGYDRGYNLASWQDLPDLGTTLSLDVDWQGIGTIETVEDQLDAWEALISAAESQNRDFSPFEMTASHINEQSNSEALWEAVEEGITAGIRGYRRKYYKLASLRKAAREYNKANA